MTTTKADALLRIEGLYKSFDGTRALEDLSLTVNAGEVLVILGPSGCGKSTLLRCVNGLEPVSAGQIFLEGREITAPGVRWSEVRQQVGMVFQSYDLFPHLNVMENVILGPLRVQRRPRKEAMEAAKTLLERVGLPDKITAFPRQLSGGQKQRVAIVRALMMSPGLMLFDEVTAALDPEMVREVLDVILELAEGGMTMLIVTHEIEFAQKVADRILFLDRGRIVEEGNPATFFQKPETERAQKFLNLFHFV